MRLVQRFLQGNNSQMLNIQSTICVYIYVHFKLRQRINDISYKKIYLKIRRYAREEQRALSDLLTYNLQINSENQ